MKTFKKFESPRRRNPLDHAARACAIVYSSNCEDIVFSFIAPTFLATSQGSFLNEYYVEMNSRLGANRANPNIGWAQTFPHLGSKTRLKNVATDVATWAI
jgi:hypothetical protein